ncbi:MAG: glycosyl hydrolase family 28-related protein [Planctomycetota bacterium]
MREIRLHLLAVLILAAASTGSAAQQWNVVEAGAVGDGATDCTAVFQRLLDEAGKAGGGVVDVPAGRFRINGSLSIPANVTLQGTYRVPPTSGPTLIEKLTGSVLCAYAGRGSEEGPPFIRLAGNNSAIVGFIIAYPEWKRSDVPPVPYPPCVLSEGTENVGIRDCCFLNPYEAIKLIRAHRHIVRNVTGYPIKRGIFVDECYDIGHIENIHFWPFGLKYDPQEPYCKWINTQGVAFELARTDWHYVFNTFCFGYGIGYKFSESKHGSTNGNFLGLGADSCRRAVVVEQAQPPGLLITNGEFVGRWSSTDSVCLEIGPKVKGKVSLVNCSFWGPIDRCVWMRSPAGQFTANACNFVHWDNGGAGSPAIQLDAGKAIVQGCTFGRDSLHVQVGDKVVSAILTANQAEGGFRVENGAGERTQMSLNETDPIAWTAEARSYYRLQIGERGDGRYLQGWHGQECSGRPFRWTMPGSRLMLPVVPDKPYTITLEINAHKHAIAPEAGLYLDGEQIAPLKDGAVLTANAPPSRADHVRLELRCKGWIPQQVIPGSKDARTLGIQVYGVTMRAEGAGTKVFSANTGEWLPPGTPKE